MKKLYKVFAVFAMVLAIFVIPTHVNATSGDITLSSDTSESITVAEGETVTLDLNGHTINGQIINHGTLTINDSVGTGKVISTDSPAIVSHNSLIVNGGTFESNVSCIELAEGSTEFKMFEIYGGTFNSGSLNEIFDVNEDSWMKDSILVYGGNFNKSIEQKRYVFFYSLEYQVDGRYIVADMPQLTIEDGVEIDVGQTYTYVPNYEAPYPTKVYWSTSDESIATIDENGTVTGVGEGLVLVKAQFSNDIVWDTYVSVYLTVGPTTVEEIKFEAIEVTMCVGEETQLNPVTTPAYAISSAVLTWSSSDETIATVDENGKVTGLKPGQTTITVKTAEGKEASVPVSVFENEIDVPTLDPTAPVEKPTTGVTADGGIGNLLFQSAVRFFPSELQSAYSVNTEIVIDEVTEESVKEDAETVFVLLEKQHGKKSHVVQYLDLSILVTADGKELGEVTETVSPIEFSIKLPAELLKHGRTFDIVRVHDGVAQLLGATLDGDILKFSSNMFSTYALVYVDEVADDDVTPPTDETPEVTPPTGDDNENGGEEDNPNTPEGGNNDTTPIDPNIPSTGDNNSVLTYVVMIAIAMTGLGTLYLESKKSRA